MQSYIKTHCNLVAMYTKAYMYREEYSLYNYKNQIRSIFISRK